MTFSCIGVIAPAAVCVDVYFNKKTTVQFQLEQVTTLDSLHTQLQTRSHDCRLYEYKVSPPLHAPAFHIGCMLCAPPHVPCVVCMSQEERSGRTEVRDAFHVMLHLRLAVQLCGLGTAFPTCSDISNALELRQLTGVLTTSAITAQRWDLAASDVDLYCVASGVDQHCA